MFFGAARLTTPLRILTAKLRQHESVRVQRNTEANRASDLEPRLEQTPKVTAPVVALVSGRFGPLVLAYDQVILEPGVGQFREFESPRVHTRINSWGLFLVHELTCGKREGVSKQHSRKTRREMGLLNPVRIKN